MRFGKKIMKEDEKEGRNFENVIVVGDECEFGFERRKREFGEEEGKEMKKKRLSKRHVID